MNKLLPIFFVCICFFTSKEVSAQKNFTEGYVVSLTGDTLKGIIDDRQWEKNPDEISFLEKGTEQVKLYTPDLLTGFGSWGGDRYESHLVEMDYSPYKLSELNYSPDPVLKEKQVFLRIFVQGRAKLMHYTDENSKIHFFLQKEGGKVDELISRRYLKTDRKGKDYVYKLNRYVGQLRYYMADCPKVVRKLSDVEFKESHLIKIVSEYNECFSDEKEDGSNLVQEKYQKKGKELLWESGVVGGLSSTSLKFTSNVNHELSKVDFSSSIRPNLGLFLDIVRNRNQKKWSLYNELLYTSYLQEGTRRIFKSEENYSISKYTFDVSYLKLVNMVRFQFPKGKFRPFLNAGIAHGIALRVGNERIDLKRFYSGETEVPGKAINDFRNYEQSLVVGAGVRHHKWSMEFRYESGNGMSKYSTLKSATNSLFLMVAYRFRG